MIHSLRVENIALIDSLQMEFAEGLNVLSGETGAGKSIIVDSMNLVLGERADREMIRTGSEKARVEAVLYVDKEKMQPVFEQYDIGPDEELIISRELSAAGKNLCRINGNAVNLSILKGFMDNVVDLLGQHEHQSLLYSVNHLELIDDFGKKPVAELKKKIADQYTVLKELETQLDGLGGDAGERMQKADLLRFQINELKQANLRKGEMEELKEERERLRNAQDIALTLNRCYQILYLGDDGDSTVLSALKNCVDSMAQITPYGKEYTTIFDKLNEYYFSLEDIAQTIGRETDMLSFDESRQNEVEERIEFISGLRRKYNATDIPELLSFIDNAREELERLENSEQVSKQLGAEIKTAKDELYTSYVELHDRREKAAQELSLNVAEQLNDLGMQNARFETRFEPLPAQADVAYAKKGPDTVEFYIATNVGEPLKPLIKTASGGEISRIMLAFKSVSAGMDKISTMIFDEIDTGISGQIAHVVAEKMAMISRSRQVICVTHLPQIAAMADRNFLISKSTKGGVANTHIRRLDDKEKIVEISRLSGGMQTKNAEAYAKELLVNAENVKKAINTEVGRVD